MKRTRINRREGAQRRGAVIVVVAFLMVVFIVAAMLTVDVSYMQLVRTDLRAATDAAAKASADVLARTEDEEQAKQAAIDIATLHTVAGRPFQISGDNVSFGRVVEVNDTIRFEAGAKPANAVRIAGAIGENEATAGIPLFFAPAMGHTEFETSQSATAVQENLDVCLVLDRSGSMAWDMSGTNWAYPPNNPNLSTFTVWGPLWRDYVSPPHPANSRWAALASAVDLFLIESSKRSPAPRTSLVTWASDYTSPVWPFKTYQKATIDVSLPARSSANVNAMSAQIRAALNQRGKAAVMGSTNLSAGLDLGVQHLVNSDSLLSSKVLILLTDGDWNAGRDPLDAAADAASQGVTVHCVTMNGGSEFVCKEIARLTGGEFFSTANEDDLKAAFEELARLLPVTLVE